MRNSLLAAAPFVALAAALANPSEGHASGLPQDVPCEQSGDTIVCTIDGAAAIHRLDGLGLVNAPNVYLYIIPGISKNSRARIDEVLSDIEGEKLTDSPSPCTMTFKATGKQFKSAEIATSGKWKCVTGVDETEMVRTASGGVTTRITNMFGDVNIHPDAILNAEPPTAARVTPAVEEAPSLLPKTEASDGKGIATQLREMKAKLEQCKAIVRDKETGGAPELKAAEAEKGKCEKLERALKELQNKVAATPAHPLKPAPGATEPPTSCEEKLENARDEVKALKELTLADKAWEEWEKALAVLAAITGTIAAATGVAVYAVTNRRRRKEQAQERRDLGSKVPAATPPTFDMLAPDERLAAHLEEVTSGRRFLPRGDAAAFYNLSVDQVNKLVRIIENRLGAKIKTKLRKGLIKAPTITDATARANAWNSLISPIPTP